MSNVLKGLLAAAGAAVVIGGGFVLLSGDDSGSAADTTTTSTTLVAVATGGGQGGTTTEPTTGDPATTTEATTTTAGLAGCALEGVWKLREQEFFDEISAISGEAVGLIQYVSGSYTMELRADGTYLAHRDALSFRVTSPEGSLLTEITSEDPGTWTADETTLSVSESGSTAEVSLWVEQNGTLIALPIPTEGLTVSTDAISGTGTYTCIGDTLVVVIADAEFGEFTVTFDRIG